MSMPTIHASVPNFTLISIYRPTITDLGRKTAEIS